MSDTLLKLWESVIDKNLCRPPVFDVLSIKEFSLIYNGFGPDSWPAELRAVMSWVYRNFKDLASVHDVQFHFSNGTEDGYQLTLSYWRHNSSVLLDLRYPLTRPWLYPMRCVAWTKLRAAYRALQAFSRPVYMAAHERRKTMAGTV